VSVRAGSGGEHFIASSDIVKLFARHFKTKVTLGGTCVRAALALNKLGIPSTLHLVSIDDHVRRLLPPGCDFICSARQDSTDPHLIVQFAEGVRVVAGDIAVQAPQSNRVIYVNDPPNRSLVLSDDLGHALRAADIFLISGFNVFQEEDKLLARLQRLRTHMRHLPPEALVYYEDGAFHVSALTRLVREVLHDDIDIHSLNEDELQSYLGRPLDLLDPEEMAAAFAELQALIDAPNIVVHTKYWAVVLGSNAATFENALQGGITMAGTRYAYGDNFTETHYRTVEGGTPRSAGAAFATLIEDRMEGAARCVPTYELAPSNPTTVGLGDSFVGGFLASLAQADRPLPARTRTRGHTTARAAEADPGSGASVEEGRPYVRQSEGRVSPLHEREAGRR
jgi:ADP-dependent phosphofructokinase/glucokinase